MNVITPVQQPEDAEANVLQEKPPKVRKLGPFRLGRTTLSFDLLAERLSTALQIEPHLTLAFEHAFRGRQPNALRVMATEDLCGDVCPQSLYSLSADFDLIVNPRMRGMLLLTLVPNG